jgi:hypothetical protein
MSEKVLLVGAAILGALFVLFSQGNSTQGSVCVEEVSFYPHLTEWRGKREYVSPQEAERRYQLYIPPVEWRPCR